LAENPSRRHHQIHQERDVRHVTIQAIKNREAVERKPEPVQENLSEGTEDPAPTRPPIRKSPDQEKSMIEEESYEPSSSEHEPEEIEQISMSREWILHQAIPDKLVDASLKALQFGHLIDPIGPDDCSILLADVRRTFIEQVCRTLPLLYALCTLYGMFPVS
jgi:hypothetical protein